MEGSVTGRQTEQNATGPSVRVCAHRQAELDGTKTRIKTETERDTRELESEKKLNGTDERSNQQRYVPQETLLKRTPQRWMAASFEPRMPRIREIAQSEAYNPGVQMYFLLEFVGFLVHHQKRKLTSRFFLRIFNHSAKEACCVRLRHGIGQNGSSHRKSIATVITSHHSRNKRISNHTSVATHACAVKVATRLGRVRFHVWHRPKTHSGVEIKPEKRRPVNDQIVDDQVTALSVVVALFP